jgi:hypothetical protein
MTMETLLAGHRYYARFSAGKVRRVLRVFDYGNREVARIRGATANETAEMLLAAPSAMIVDLIIEGIIQGASPAPRRCTTAGDASAGEFTDCA